MVVFFCFISHVHFYELYITYGRCQTIHFIYSLFFSYILYIKSRPLMKKNKSKSQYSHSISIFSLSRHIYSVQLLTNRKFSITILIFLDTRKIEICNYTIVTSFCIFFLTYTHSHQERTRMEEREIVNFILEKKKKTTDLGRLLRECAQD